MKKTLVVNMNYVDIQGDLLDLSCDDSGVIYSISKDIEQELSVDYIDESSRNELEGRTYDACTFFFNLNNIVTKKNRHRLIKEVSKYIKTGGKIFLWDVNKKRGKIINNKVEILLPNGKIKEGTLKNNNLISKCDYDQILKIIEKYYTIEENKLWEEMFFIKGVKK